MTKTTLRSLSRVYRAAARLLESLSALRPADRREASWPARIVLRLAWLPCWLTTEALVRYDTEHIALQRLRRRSRDLQRNDPIAESAIGSVVISTIGPGLVPMPMPDADAALTLASVGDYRRDDQADEARDVAAELAASREED